MGYRKMTPLPVEAVKAPLSQKDAEIVSLRAENPPYGIRINSRLVVWNVGSSWALRRRESTPRSAGHQVFKHPV